MINLRGCEREVVAPVTGRGRRTVQRVDEDVRSLWARIATIQNTIEETNAGRAWAPDIGEVSDAGDKREIRRRGASCVVETELRRDVRVEQRTIVDD